MRAFVAASLILLAGCAHPRRPGPVAASGGSAEAGPAWTRLIGGDDQTRLDDLPRRFVNAGEIARRVSPRRATAEAPLLRPGGALSYVMPSPGPYRCRRIRILPEPRRFTSEAPGFCALQPTDNEMGFVMQTGGERPDGYLFPDGATRMVLLGGEAPGRSGRAPGYGTPGAVSVVGVLERIGDFRWRLAIPTRAHGLDIIEMVPIAPKMRGDTGAVQASDAP